MRYTVLLDPDPDGEGYTVTVPMLRGCVTQGRTIDEALDRAKEAIEGFIETLAKGGEAVPIEEPPLIALTVEGAVEAPTMVGAGT